MACRITGKKLEGNFLGAPTTSCKPKDYPTKERITIELNGKTYERTIHERIIWRASGKHTLKARFVIIDGGFWEVEEASETLTIDGIEWEPKTFEELRGMGFIPDKGTSGAIRTDQGGNLWSAMMVDECWSCELADSEGGWLDTEGGDSLEEAIRNLQAKHPKPFVVLMEGMDVEWQGRLWHVMTARNGESSLFDGRGYGYLEGYILEDARVITEKEVTIRCYRRDEKWASRQMAAAFYLEAIENSEGSEQERYVNIALDLLKGKNYASDRGEEW